MELTQADHEKFMRRAIELAHKASIDFSTGGVFGAVIVRNGEIIAEGMNRVVASHDPTWHAEMEAIRLACTTLQNFKLDDCILYASGEPCPMCLATSYWAGIPTIYYASGIEDALEYGNFDDSFISAEFMKPKEERKIKPIQILRDEAVSVWKEYAAKTDKVPY
ncbi:guanine deaminase [soil metagenome]